MLVYIRHVIEHYSLTPIRATSLPVSFGSRRPQCLCHMGVEVANLVEVRAHSGVKVFELPIGVDVVVGDDQLDAGVKNSHVHAAEPLLDLVSRLVATPGAVRDR